jgi:hypothetical protein
MARVYFEDDAENGIKHLATRTPEMVRLVEASIAARVALAETAPTTKAGLVSVLRFVREQSDPRGQFFLTAGRKARALSPRSSRPCLACSCNANAPPADQAGGHSISGGYQAT